MTSIEHFEPRSRRPDLENDYGNCLYACRFCNRSRGDRPVLDSQGRSLLNPTVAGWADHFLMDGDVLRPRTGRRDAEYTAEAYDLSDPEKAEIRRERREGVPYCLDMLDRGPRLIGRLRDAVERDLISGETDRIARARLDLDALRLAEQALARAAREIARWQAVPRDADAVCRCQHEGVRALPAALTDGLIEVVPHSEEPEVAPALLTENGERQLPELR